MIITKLKKPHINNCNAFNQEWRTVWGVYKYTIFTRKNSLRKKGNTMWFVFGCNICACDAEIAVKADSFLEKLPNYGQEK